ncbi:MAG: hypothetical protein MZV70_54695 [Desulfobacterales bacterium]|nr:hypothetical protein [Desulfobacterales bacterium]
MVKPISNRIRPGFSCPCRPGRQRRRDQRYVTRGVVKRSAQMDRLGRFALLRGNMVCCLADAIAMGMMVSGHGLPAAARR